MDDSVHPVRRYVEKNLSRLREIEGGRMQKDGEIAR
jgi:hypothetical protein